MAYNVIMKTKLLSTGEWRTHAVAMKILEEFMPHTIPCPVCGQGEATLDPGLSGEHPTVAYAHEGHKTTIDAFDDELKQKYETARELFRELRLASLAGVFELTEKQTRALEKLVKEEFLRRVADGNFQGFTERNGPIDRHYLRTLRKKGLLRHEDGKYSVKDWVATYVVVFGAESPITL